MNKIKAHRGITLIALIITIIILLILAVVTIGSIKNSSIITYAQNAATDYNSAKADEESAISGHGSLIESKLPGISVIGKATVGTIVNEHSTINGEIYSSINPVIPKGFMAINVTTEGHESSWDVEGGPQVTEGLVISDGTSEFVWIPVSDIDSFARLQDNSETNYQGVLYDFSATTATEKSNYGVGTTSDREPDNLSDSTSNMSIWTETLYQDSFNKMVASVSKYGGFYVGRYETSLKGSVAQSKSGERPMSGDWYRAYENSLTYSNNNTNLGVTSEMIWGCQWDAMLKFILTGNESDHVVTSENVSHNLSTSYSTGGIDYTGSVTYNDIASNIYDLEGNLFEWNQRAKASVRGVRGGAWGSKASIKPGHSMFMLDPTKSSYKFIGASYYCGLGSRLALYIV